MAPPHSWADLCLQQARAPGSVPHTNRPAACTCATRQHTHNTAPPTSAACVAATSSRIIAFSIGQAKAAVRKKSPPTGAFSTLNLSDRFPWENRDCAVVSLSTACGIPYEKAHALLKEHGRGDGKPTYGKTVSAALGIRYQSLSRVRRPTAAQFIRENPRGRFIVFATDHFFALIDGVHMDADASLYRPRARLWGYWPVEAVSSTSEADTPDDGTAL